MIEDADRYYKNKQYVKAARLYEDSAEAATSKTQKILLYRKAIGTYRELGSTHDEVRCLLTLCSLFNGLSKIGYLLECWRAYIKAIERHKYETGFEWKGEENNLSEDYSEVIEDYLNEATKTLNIILEIPNVDSNKLLEILSEDCANRENEGGWAANECWKSIQEAWKNNRERNLLKEDET